MQTRSRRIIAVGGMVGAFLVGGATYGAVQFAGATAPGTTFYACLKAGKLTNVTTAAAPSCLLPAINISWDSAGPQGVQGIQGPKGDTGQQGPVGPQGLSDAQYIGNNAWSGSFSSGGGPVPNLPMGKTLTITNVSAQLGANCYVSGTLNGNPVTFTWGGWAQPPNGGYDIVQPANLSGLQWSLGTNSNITIGCSNGVSYAVAASGYLS